MEYICGVVALMRRFRMKSRFCLSLGITNVVMAEKVIVLPLMPLCVLFSLYFVETIPSTVFGY